MRADQNLCPERFKHTLTGYAEHGLQPGGFLLAVLSNDLFDAVFRADGEALDVLPHIVAFIHFNLPSASHGSRTATAEWLAMKRSRVG